MSNWKLADVSINAMNHGGFVEARYVNDEQQSSLSVSFDRPNDLEGISVGELIKRLDEARDKALKS
jgi:hypothetical protein|tara:strand:+ start:89 stop:286 length:198 start_codon:yes stop_codon:yes gene_type:complete